MKVEDYRLADCALFRLPPVDVSEVKDAIEDALLNAWRRGYNVDSAIDSVLNDDGVIGKLEKQIAANLEFQREKAMEYAGKRSQSEMDIYEKFKARGLDHILRKYSGEISEREQEKETLYERLTERHGAYSAAQAHLEKVRAIVRAKLKQIGGKEGFEALLEIKKALGYSSEGDYSLEEAYSPEEKKAPKKARKRHKKEPLPLEKALALIEKERSQALKVTKNGLVEEELERRHRRNIIYRIFKKIWDLLNRDML